MNECQYCRRTISQFEMFGLVLRNGKFLKTCPDCYKIIHDKEVKDLEVSRQSLAKSGLLEQGFNSSDLKELLKRWTKNQIEQV